MTKKLKILFICGSLEYGKDGVGDYTRRLASQLMKMGHFCRIVALMDKFISQSLIENQNAQDKVINSLRLPYENGLKNNIEETKIYIDKFAPDFISLQFVPFSFNNKGLPFNIVSSLASLTSMSTFQIMFHELWVGMEKGTSLKQYFWGFVQKLIISRFSKICVPKVVHTQTNLYKHELEILGFKVHLLPLFSNIVESDVENVHRKLSLNESIKQKSSLCCVIFGEIHFGAPVINFSNDLLKYTSKNNLSVTLLILGKCGIESEIWKNYFIENGFSVNVVGWQTSENVLKHLSNADFGITTTPYALTDKSGSVAAMQSVGLPVVCVARDWAPRINIPVLSTLHVYEYKEGNLEDWLESTDSMDFDSKETRKIEKVANQFIIDLTN